jgi:hypothetical protein
MSFTVQLPGPYNALPAQSLSLLACEPVSGLCLEAARTSPRPPYIAMKFIRLFDFKKVVEPFGFELEPIGEAIFGEAEEMLKHELFKEMADFHSRQ